MKRLQDREILAELPSTGEPFTSSSTQTLVNSASANVLQTIAKALGGGMIADVVGTLFTVTPTQQQKLQQVQSNPSSLAQIVQMCGATGMLNQDVANTLNWILKQLG